MSLPPWLQRTERPYFFISKEKTVAFQTSRGVIAREQLRLQTGCWSHSAANLLTRERETWRSPVQCAPAPPYAACLPTATLGFDSRRPRKKARPSFLKKRSKRLLVMLSRRFLQCAPKGTKVFWFFFSKRTTCLACHPSRWPAARALTPVSAHCEVLQTPVACNAQRSITSSVDVADAYNRPAASHSVASLNAARRPKVITRPTPRMTPVCAVIALW